MVIAAVNFNDQPELAREEIGDVTSEHDLPPKPHAETTTANGAPQHRFRRRGRESHLVRSLRENRLPICRSAAWWLRLLRMSAYSAGLRPAQLSHRAEPVTRLPNLAVSAKKRLGGGNRTSTNSHSVTNGR